MKNRQRYILWMLVVIISVNLLVGVSAIFYPTVYAFTGSAALDKDVLLHPADQDGDWRLIMSETILYLLGWQQGTNTLEYAIRAAYLWQNGEYYTFDSEQTGSLRWVLQSAPPEGEQEGEVIIEGETVPASVIFTLGPAEAVAQGTVWYLDGNGPFISGESSGSISPGSHVVSFSVLAGWIRPEGRRLLLEPGEVYEAVVNYTAQLKSTDLVVFGYNELGMHCMNQDFSEFMILPPYNTLYAQIVDRTHGSPEIVRSGVALRYTIQSNTVSNTKTNFWEYAEQLFGRTIAPNVGLTGNQLSGVMTVHASPRTDWEVTGIPITPLDDTGTENPYPLATITVSRGGQDIVQTQAVVPVSWEISCEMCHNTPGITPATDILRKHDEMHATTLESVRPVACGKCHAQPELGMPGNGTSHNLSRAMHGAHASRMTGELSVTCYACHPGIRTQCQRDVHLSRGMNCVDCHGEMSDVADPVRVPWETEPRCETCHDSMAPAAYEFEQPGVLYRNSKGHRNIMCAACHGSPHAITPTVKIEDNIQAIAIQGHAGVINTCSVCHSEVPDDPFPHSIHEE